MKNKIPTPNHTNDAFNMALYERLFQINQSAVISLDVEMRIVDVSNAIETLIGYDRQTLIGAPYSELLAFNYREPFHKLLTENAIVQLDYPLVDQDGNWQWVHHSGETAGKDANTRYNFIINPINRYKQPHNQVESERNMLREIIDNLPAAIYVADTQGKFIFSNLTHANSLGKTHAVELLGLHYSDMFSKADQSYLQAQDQEVIKTGRNLVIEEQRLSDDQQEHWFNVHKIPMYNTQGQIDGVLGIERDITSEKLAQQQLENSEARHRALLNTLPDMMFVVRRDGTITEYKTTDEAESLNVGRSVIGMNLLNTNFPQPLVEETRLYLDIDIERHYLHTFEFTQILDEHHEEHYETRLIRLNEDEIMALIRNVSSIKRIQDELNQHIEDLTIVRQVNVELAADLSVNYVSQLALDAALRLSNAQTGYLVMVLPTGKLALISVVGKYNAEQLEQSLTLEHGIVPRAIASGKPQLIFDVHADEDYVPLLDGTRAMMIIPLNSNDRIVGVLVLEATRPERFSHERFQFLQLITGRIAAFLDNAMLHRQTKEQYEEVRYLEQLKTDMIRIASHDLKNPLSAIMGYMEMLREDVNKKLNEKELGYLDKIEIAARKMQRITMGILSLERIQQFAEQQSHKIVNLKTLMARCVSDQADYAVRSEQKLHRHLPEDAVYVQGDPLQIHEAISNLVQNAIKYTPRHGTVHVYLTVTERSAQVRVIDNGYGIPDELQERLFSPFYRARTSETRFIEGTGLGLHLVKNIIERHDGSMLFESTYGEGSTFGFDLPLAPDHLLTPESTRTADLIE
ncbi:MAG: PAS domain S-box protein [Anaerolineae bacterium]